MLRSTGNDGTYDVDTVALVGSNTEVKTVQAISSGVADGEMGWIDVAIRYYPELATDDCCYCKSYRMRMEIEPTDDAYNFYDTTSKLDAAIRRMKNKIYPVLTPVHTRVSDWAIKKRYILENIINGGNVSQELTGEFVSDKLANVITVNQVSKVFTINGDRRSDIVAGGVFNIIGSTGNDGSYTIASVTLNGANTDVEVTGVISSSVADGGLHTMPTKISVSVDARGDMSGGKQMYVAIYDDTPAIVWFDFISTGVSDPDTWYNEVLDDDITSLIGNNNPVRIYAEDFTGTIAYGDVRFKFTVSKYSQERCPSHY